MKKIILLLAISASMLQGMEERPFFPSEAMQDRQKQEQIIASEAMQLWKLLGNSGEPHLQFIAALNVIKLKEVAIKWVKIPQELKKDLLTLQSDLGEKLLDLIKELKNGCEEPIKLLINAGADVNILDKHGGPLAAATVLGDKEIAGLLIKVGADLNIQDSDGKTPLMRAAYLGDKAVVGLLISEGADLNIRDNEGRTALMRAAGYGGHKKVVEMLIAAGADFSIRDNKYRTACNWAAEFKKQKIVMLFKDAQRAHLKKMMQSLNKEAAASRKNFLF